MFFKVATFVALMSAASAVGLGWGAGPLVGHGISSQSSAINHVAPAGLHGGWGLAGPIRIAGHGVAGSWGPAGWGLGHGAAGAWGLGHGGWAAGHWGNGLAAGNLKANGIVGSGLLGSNYGGMIGHAAPLGWGKVAVAPKAIW